jgi:hypothetical protein
MFRNFKFRFGVDILATVLATFSNHGHFFNLLVTLSLALLSIIVQRLGKVRKAFKNIIDNVSEKRPWWVFKEFLAYFFRAFL